MSSGNDCGFKCVKYTMVVLFAVDIIGKIAFLALVSTAMNTLGHTDMRDGTTKADIQAVNEVWKITFPIVVGSLIVGIIGLVGAIKEHQITMMLMTVLCLLQVVYVKVNINTNSSQALVPMVICILVAFLNGVYTYMIIQKNKYNQENGKNFTV